MYTDRSSAAERKINIPDGYFSCWHITEDDRINAIIRNIPFIEITRDTNVYFKMLNRIDSNYIEGNIGRIDSQTNEFIMEDVVLTNVSYIGDYMNRKPVYFTFDKISLYKLIEINRTKPLRFILWRLDKYAFLKTNQVFMIMPFNHPVLESFYQSEIKGYLKSEMNIDVMRANDVVGNDIVVETIYKMIAESEIVIAETTEHNKNVFYEMGYAAALGKEIITIQNSSERQLFFDRAHIRSIIYSANNMVEFRNNLKNTVLAVRQKYNR